MPTKTTCSQPMNNATYMKSVAIFLVMLVLTLPFYSANAYASLRVTKNSGEDNIDGFVDAQGDLWKLEVEAAIPGETITASRLTMNGFPFQSCAQNPGGVFGCVYSVDFRSRTIPEATVPIEVKLNKQDGTLSDRATGNIAFDGSAPQITELVVSQKAQDVEVKFKIKERPDTCVGMKKIEFFEDLTSLKALEGSVLDVKMSNKCGVNDITESMPLSASTATRTIKVVATDKLGHARTVTRSLFFDGQAPVINASSFKAGYFGRFVPSGNVNVRLSIQAREERNTLFGLLKIASLNINEEVACTKADGVFTCVWDITADFSQNPSIEVTVRDSGGRTETRTFTSQFTVDNTKPVADYFGTLRQLSGVNYAGKNTTIVAKFTESGSGMASVAADLSELGNFGRHRTADECVQVSGKWECYWRGLDVIRKGRIFLVEAKDKVGNEASLPGADIVLDRTAPDIVENSLDVQVVVEAASDEKYIYQSGDWLTMEFDVVEANGLFAAEVDETDIVDDGEVRQATCVLNQSTGVSHCTHITHRIKSGHALASFSIRAEDMAGNWEEAAKPIEIQGKDTETTPTHWSVKEVKCSPEGLDVNTMKLVNQRVFCTVEFQTSANVELVQTKLLRCDGDVDAVQNKFMVANFGGSKKPGLVLEFKVLDEEQIDALLGAGASTGTAAAGGSASGSGVGTTASAPIEDTGLQYRCKFGLLTKRGNQVIQQREEEMVEITIPFFETPFDNELSTIEDKIEDAKDDAENDLWKLIGTLSEILNWVKVICNMLPVLNTIIIIFDVVNTALGNELRPIPLAERIAAANCHQTGQTQYSLKSIIEYLDILCKIASCQTSQISGDWYSQWQKRVLDTYNQWSQRQALGKAARATSLTDNLVISSIGLCLPGVVLNLNKYRQIQCRYVGCLESDVNAGVATVESCRELRDYQECKYIWGEIFQVIPFAGAVDQLLGVLKSILTDPVGAVRMIIVLGCETAWCELDDDPKLWCTFFGVIVFIIDTIDAIVSSLNQIETTTRADYCSQVL